MAKYTIHHACGHTTTQQIYGKVAGRERKIEWWQSVDCPECYRQGRKAVLAKEREQERSAAAAWLADHPELPALSGSEKQIAWANVIRASILAEAEKLVAGLHIQADQLEPWMLILVDKWHAELQEQSSATWWIEHRHQTGDQVLASRNVPAIMTMTFDGHTPKQTAMSLLDNWLNDQPEVIAYREKVQADKETKAKAETARKESAVKAFLAPLEKVNWLAEIEDWLADSNADPYGFDVVVDGHKIEICTANDDLYVNSIDGQDKIEINGDFICWLAGRPEVQAVRKKINAIRSDLLVEKKLATFIVGDRPGTITANLDDPDYQYLTMRARDGRQATIVMWSADEWELVTVGGSDIPTEAGKSKQARRIIETACELYNN